MLSKQVKQRIQDNKHRRAYANRHVRRMTLVQRVKHFTGADVVLPRRAWGDTSAVPKYIHLVAAGQPNVDALRFGNMAWKPEVRPLLSTK
jgi:hypothetical protein